MMNKAQNEWNESLKRLREEYKPYCDYDKVLSEFRYSHPDPGTLPSEPNTFVSRRKLDIEDLTRYLQKFVKKTIPEPTPPKRQSTLETRLLFDKYKNYVLDMSVSTRYRHLDDAIVWFRKRRDFRWAEFLQLIQHVSQNGDENIAEHYSWNDARLNITDSEHFETFAKTIRSL